MTTRPCVLCTKPALDGYACKDCATLTRRALHLIADLTRYADDKRARFGSTWRAGTIGRTPEAPLPYDPRVTAVVGKVTTTLRKAYDLAQKTNPSAVYAAGHPAAVAIWLTSNVDVLRKHPDGPKHLDRIQAAAELIEKLFDGPPAKIYVGRCNHDGCPESLYADRDHTATVVKCTKCAHEHPITERREQLATGVEDYLGTIKEISRLLRETLGDDVSERMIRGLVDHGMIQPRGTRLEWDKLARPRQSMTLRIGDVREAVTLMRSDKATKRAVQRHAREVTA